MAVIVPGWRLSAFLRTFCGLLAWATWLGLVPSVRPSANIWSHLRTWRHLSVHGPDSFYVFLAEPKLRSKLVSGPALFLHQAEGCGAADPEQFCYLLDLAKLGLFVVAVSGRHAHIEPLNETH